MSAELLHSWDLMRQQIAAEFSEHPLDYLRQPTITRALHPDQPDLAHRYAGELLSTSFGRMLMAHAREPEHGRPRRSEACGGYSMLALQHAWQIAKLWEYLAVPPGALRYIAEIGGGYGDMCRQLRESAFAGGYSIFDFPELHAVQAAYLRAVPCRAALVDLNGPGGLQAQGPGSLLLATFSVSEMPVALREHLEPAFYSYDFLAFSWNESFSGIDNMAWFLALGERLRRHYRVTTMKDPHMRAWYLFARQR